MGTIQGGTGCDRGGMNKFDLGVRAMQELGGLESNEEAIAIVGDKRFHRRKTG